MFTLWQSQRNEAVLKCLLLFACEYHHRHGVGRIDMGNEMGNNNTSGLKEEDNTNAVDSKNLLQEAADEDDVKVENQIVPTPEAKDLHEKDTGLASDYPTEAKDPHTENETSGGREQEENQVHFPTESPKAVMKSIETSSEDSEVKPSSWKKDSDVNEKTIESNFEVNLLERSDHQLQKQDSINEEQEENEVYPPAESLKAVVKSIGASDEENEIKEASSPKDSEVHEKPIDSNLEENLLGTSDHQLEKQTSISEEEEESRESTFNTISTPHDPEPQQSLNLKSVQHLLDQVNADQSEEDGCGLLHKSEDILGTSFKCANKKNGHLGPDISNNLGDNPNLEKKLGDSLIEEAPSQGEKMSYKEEIEIIKGDEIGTGLSNLTTIASDTPSIVGNKCNEEFELSSEANSIRNDSLNLQLEAVPLDRPLNSNQEVSEPEDKCMVLTEETKIVGSGSDIEEKPHQYNPNLFCKEPVKEQKTDEANGMRRLVDMSGNFRSSKDCQTEEEKVAADGYKLEVFVSNQNKNSNGSCKESEGELLVDAEHGLVPVIAELIVTDHRCEEEQPEEKKILEEIEEKAEASYATGNDTEGSETTRQCSSQLLPIQKAEALLSQSQFHNEPIPELKQESCDEFSVVKASTFTSTSLKIENLVSAAELVVEKPGQDLSQESAHGVLGEVAALTNGSTEAQESVGRFSSESSSDSMNTHVQMRKSPSFDLDLRIEARGEDSDQMPLLFHDKATMDSSSSQQADITLGNPVVQVGYKCNQHILQYQAMPVEEKVITLERSDSEKSKTPFLGFLKEEEEAQFVVTPQKQENSAIFKKATTEEAASTPAKGKEKRKPRSSFFGNCMCCATVIN